MSFLTENIGTFTVAALLLAAAAFAVYSLKKDKKSGKSSCGAGCASCALHDKCHGGSR